MTKALVSFLPEGSPIKYTNLYKSVARLISEHGTRIVVTAIATLAHEAGNEELGAHLDDCVLSLPSDLTASHRAAMLELLRRLGGDDGTVGIELGLCLSVVVPVALVCAHVIAAPLHNYLAGIDTQLTAAQAALAALQGCAP